jgi:hypothetical protein
MRHQTEVQKGLDRHFVLIIFCVGFVALSSPFTSFAQSLDKEHGTTSTPKQCLSIQLITNLKDRAGRPIEVLSYIVNNCSEGIVIAECYVYDDGMYPLGWAHTPEAVASVADCRTSYFYWSMPGPCGELPNLYSRHVANVEELKSFDKDCITSARKETDTQNDRKQWEESIAAAESSPIGVFVVPPGGKQQSAVSTEEGHRFWVGCLESRLLAGQCWPDPLALWRKLGSPETYEAAGRVGGNK